MAQMSCFGVEDPAIRPSINGHHCCHHPGIISYIMHLNLKHPTLEKPLMSMAQLNGIISLILTANIEKKCFFITLTGSCVDVGSSRCPQRAISTLAVFIHLPPLPLLVTQIDGRSRAFYVAKELVDSERQWVSTPRGALPTCVSSHKRTK